ncbi:MAG: hypothetical protein CL583_17740 [Alteromonadaceae bacterium]|nr:hypothetical protein [Alteromonadaceae bacterium]
MYVCDTWQGAIGTSKPSGHSNNTGDLAEVTDMLALCTGAMVNWHRKFAVALSLKITTEYENMKERA